MSLDRLSPEQGKDASFWREALAHALLLVAFAFVLRVFGSIGEASAVDAFWSALDQSVVDSLLLSSMVMAVAMVARRASGKPGVRGWLVAVPIAVLYVLLVCQVRFHTETGTYISRNLMGYAATNLGEVWTVIGESAMRVSSIVALLLAVVFLCAARPVGSRMGRLVLVAAVPGVILALVACAFLLRDPDMKQRWTSDSALLALMRPTYPVKVDSNVPEYARPVVVVPESGATAPNIVFIVLESTRANSVPFFAPEGAETASMPNLSALAAKSRIFLDAYTTTSHTSKALVGILCGIHPNPDMPIAESTPGGLPAASCLPRVLGDAGYSTLFMQSATARFENRPGLVSNLGFGKGLYKEDIAAGYSSSGYFGLDEAALVPPFRDWWADNAGRPRFATILTSMTHHPYEEIGGDGRKGDLAAYLAVLGYVDDVLQQVLDVIDTAGDSGNTVVVVTGDHGEAFGEHGPRQHDSVPFDEVTRVPLLVWDGRGVVAPGVDRELRQHIDLLPTIVSLLGGNVSDGSGIDLLKPAGHDQVLTSCWYPGACIAKVQGDMKWIYSATGRLVIAFDRKADPYETTNLGGTFPYSRRQEVAMELLRWQESVRRLHGESAGR